MIHSNPHLFAEFDHCTMRRLIRKPKFVDCDQGRFDPAQLLRLNSDQQVYTQYYYFTVQAANNSGGDQTAQSI